MGDVGADLGQRLVRQVDDPVGAEDEDEADDALHGEARAGGALTGLRVLLGGLLGRQLLGRDPPVVGTTRQCRVPTIVTRRGITNCPAEMKILMRMFIVPAFEGLDSMSVG